MTIQVYLLREISVSSILLCLLTGSFRGLIGGYSGVPLKRKECLFNLSMVHSGLQAAINGQLATPAGIIKFLHRREQ